MKKRNSIFITLIILLGLNALAWIAVFSLTQRSLEVIFFDVGQGDAIFIETSLGYFEKSFPLDT